MARDFPEKAHLNVDKEKFDKNYDKIYGKKKCENKECEYYFRTRLNGCSKFKIINVCEVVK